MVAEDFHQLILDTPIIASGIASASGIIQHEDHFTFYVIVDHVHTDPMLMACLFVEIHQTYVALLEGGAPPQLRSPAVDDTAFASINTRRR